MDCREEGAIEGVGCSGGNFSVLLYMIMSKMSNDVKNRQSMRIYIYVCVCSCA